MLGYFKLTVPSSTLSSFYSGPGKIMDISDLSIYEEAF